MTTFTNPAAATDHAVLRALCWPSPPDQTHLPGWPIGDTGAGLGGLLERAILHKVLCLLADRLATTGLDRDLPLAISRFLSSTLRANQYKTSVYRAEIARIMVAFGEADLTAAALNGIAAESSLYGGRGARQFSDLDLLLAPADITVARTVLIDLGYSSSPKYTAFTRHIDDILVPRITVDLTQAVHDAQGEDSVREVLSRRTWQPIPGHDRSLPILAAPDALLHCLARLERTATLSEAGAPRWSICADALRLVRVCETLPTHLDSLVPTAAAGWARLRRIWPELPPTPVSVPGACDADVNAMAGRKQ